MLEGAVSNGRRHGGGSVSDVLELRMLHMMGHHGVVGGRVRVLGKGGVFVVIIIVVAVLLAHEVLGALVFVCAAIVLVATNGLVDVARRELVQLLVVAEDDDSHVDRTENGELVGLFEQAALALEEGDRAVAVVLDGLDLNLSAAHGEWRMLDVKAHGATGRWASKGSWSTKESRWYY